MLANQMHKAKHGAAHAMAELCESKNAVDLFTVPQNFHPILIPNGTVSVTKQLTYSKSREDF